MKQTAVEWLINELKNTSGSYRGFNNIDITHDEIISKAKEMEKEQMCQFAFDYQDAFYNNGKVPPVQDYYNETFNTNEK